MHFTFALECKPSVKLMENMPFRPLVEPLHRLAFEPLHRLAFELLHRLGRDLLEATVSTVNITRVRTCSAITLE